MRSALSRTWVHSRSRSGSSWLRKSTPIESYPGKNRAEDIPILTEYFLKEAAVEIGSQVTGITEAAMMALVNYDWPGNIRQLRNCIRTMVVMCDRKELDVADIPPEVHQVRQLSAGARAPRDLAGI